MASWKDGAAYAPVERPDGFATPVADPLPAAEPYRAETPGPMTHPRGFEPLEQPALTQLGVTTKDTRNPREEFAVASLAITAAPGKESGRNPKDAFTVSTSSPVTGGPPPPTGAPLSTMPPTGAPISPTYPAGQTPPLPSYVGQYGQPNAQQRPGQPGQWPPPVPYGDPSWQPQQVSEETKRQKSLCWIAATVAGCGVVLSPAAPFLLVVAGGLGLRTRKLTGYLGPIALIVGGAALLFQLLDGSLGRANLLLIALSLATSLGYFLGGARAK